MTIAVPIITSFIAGGAAILLAFSGALFNLYGRLGRLEKGQEVLEKLQAELVSEIRSARDHFDAQFTAAEKRALAREDAAEKRALAREDAAEKRALAREDAAEERALARYNELLAIQDAAEKRALAREDAAEERALARHALAMESLAAVEERALARESAAEERALARHNELLAEIRLWRTHGHDADGNIFFRVPE